MLSIDVGSEKICIIEGTYKKGQIIVTSCSETPYKGEIVVNGEVRDRAALSFLINEVIKTNNIKSKAAILTINSSDIITRNLKLPSVKLPQLQQLVKNEVMKITGQDPNFVIDFTIWEKTEDQMLQVMAYALPQEMVTAYYHILRECKLRPYALDIHANAINKLFANKRPNSDAGENANMLIADIGYTKINFHGFVNGKSVFNRSESSPVQAFVREFSALQHTDDSTQVIKELDFSPDFVHEDPAVGESCRYLLSRLEDEIQKYNQYILINSPEKLMPKLYLCGGIVSSKNLDTTLADRLKQPVEVMENIENVTLPAGCMLSRVCNAVGALIRTK